MITGLARRSHAVSGGYEISIAEKGDGPPVVFLHGSGPGASGASNFAANIDAFADAGYRVLLPDLIGYGASSMPTGIDYTLDLFASTVLEALGAAGVDRAVLIGNSLGGGIAMQIALDRPDFVTKLIMMAPGCIEDLPVYFAMPGISRMVGDFSSPDFTMEDQRKLVENLVYDASVVTDELVAERYAVARTQPKDVLSRMRTPNLASRLGELAMPILGFWGRQDEFCPASGADRFLEACADARFMSFNKVGHWVQVERSEEFNRYSLAFIGG